MRAITRAEFDRLGAAEVMRQVREGKESIGLINSSTGEVSMVIPYMPPAHACACSACNRLWICVACDGTVPQSGEGKGRHEP